MKLAIALLVATACTRPSEDRAYMELEVGIAKITDASVVVAGGLAVVRDLTDHKLELWANAPDIRAELVLGDTAAGEWTVIVRNSMSDAVLREQVGDSYVQTSRTGDDGPTVATFQLQLAAGTHLLRVGPLDADIPGPFQVAAMADIQKALPQVDDVFTAINAVPEPRFVVGMGDITERSEDSEYETFDRQLAYLRIPFYTTLGNHELWDSPQKFFDRYGRASFQFEFKGVMFTFADSGDAAIDPLVDDQLVDWLRDARGKTSVFLTHMPPIDPVGVRYGSFRSTRDGQRMLSRLVDGQVDLTLYGHIHTFVEYENAGIPAFISGGGGAQPMKGDGIDRHFLVVHFDATETGAARLTSQVSGVPGGVRRVDLHRVDD
ncbi:MAG: metallophosphoesterase [Kofleriaceae bacterium]